ncbi:c-type cytochrome [Roseovarius sp. S1116L3]|uniref:c-type cytochrome n=1 Tax=Roseovarius roseus TaxID=3342636 RepID=UPI003727A4B0
MQTALRILAALVLAGVALAAVIYFGFSGAGPVPSPSRELASLSDTERGEMIAQGAYVAKAGDCAACHESEDGLALAGGTPMETPMGVIYGTNITPHEEYGIGGYSADDLYRVMVYGIAPQGRRLYPAMPYTSYHAVSRADVDALYLYLMAQAPVAKPNRDLEMPFPLNLRPLIAFWNVLFRPDPPEDAGPGLSGGDALGQDRRGDYLVNVLGHCGECHTPRNLAYAKTGAHLAGTVIEGAVAPDITPAGLSQRTWTPDDLSHFLSTGLAPQGVMTFRMFPVLSHSTKYMSERDIDAVTGYLTSNMPRPATPPDDVAAAEAHPEGRKLYVGLCAGCHGTEGAGQPFGSVPMKGNTTLMLQDPLNLHRVIREGIPARRLSGYLRMQEMPAFEHRLSETELEALSDYLRARWGIDAM